MSAKRVARLASILLLAVSGIAAAPLPAFAAARAPATVAGRPYTPAIACTAARAIVAARGAVVLGTGPDLYDRYVASDSFCSRDEDPMAAFVPSAEGPSCFVGYTCVRRSMSDRP